MSGNKKASISLPKVAGKTSSSSGGSSAISIKKGTTDKSTITAEKLPSISPSKPATIQQAIKAEADLLKFDNFVPDAATSAADNEVATNAKKEVDEAAAILATAAAATATAAAEETKRIVEEEAARKLRSNGNVVLIYEQYNESFPIVDGCTTHAAIDDVYCLSFVMPNCLIHVSTFPPVEKRKLEVDGSVDLFLSEEPRGTYHGLEAGNTYYVYVEQEADQLARDQERMRSIATEMEGAPKSKDNTIVRDDGRAIESCSCIYGNPCVDEYGCRDWSNRYAIATTNGWKGF